MNINKAPVFTAITFDLATKRLLMKLINNLDSFSATAVCHPEPEGRLHLTLNYQPYAYPIEPLIERLSKISIESFSLRLSGLGVFRNKDTDVIWVGVDYGLNELFRLKNLIEREFESLGYSGRNGIYRPHITLAYAKGASLRENAKELFSPAAHTMFSVDSFHIFREIKDENGMRFDPMHTFPLKARKGRAYE